MQAFTKSKHIIKRTVVGGTALALILTPTAALAHSSTSNNDSPGSSHNTTAAHHAQKNKDNKDRNDWFNRNRNRQKLTCSQRQDALNQAAADIKAKDTKRLTGLNIIFNGVQTYVSSGGITVTNYDAMNAQVTADQTAATNAVNAISAPQLNCGDPNSAAAVSDDNKTFHDRDTSMNNSINAAQQSLVTYRKDLNTLFEAVINS